MHEQLPYAPPPEKGENYWGDKGGDKSGMGIGGQGGAGFGAAPPTMSAVIFGSDAQVSST
jgi:hypothetical protein